MKKYFVLVFLLVPSLAFASQKVFYHSLDGLQIVDVSGQKTIEQIVEEFDLVDASFIQEIIIDETQESVRINESGQLVKYNYKLEAQQRADERKEIKERKEFLIKKKLGLTDSDWVDLKEALGVN